MFDFCSIPRKRGSIWEGGGEIDESPPPSDEGKNLGEVSVGRIGGRARTRAQALRDRKL
jgi:hypothetical protein